MNSASALPMRFPVDCPVDLKTLRVPKVSSRMLLFALTTLLVSVFLTAQHQWDRSGLTDYVESAEERAVAAVNGNTTRRAAFLMLGTCGCLLLLTSGRIPAIREPLSILLLLATAWVFCSVSWATAAGYTTKRLLLLLLVMSGVAGIASRINLRQLALITLAVSTGYLTLGLTAELLQANFRPWASGYRFAGTLHPNAQGANCAAMALSAFAVWRDNRRKLDGTRLSRLLLFIAIVFLMLTKSRTVILAMLVVSTVLWATRKRMVVNLLAVTGAVLLAAILAYATTVVGDHGLWQANMGRDDSYGFLNGRLPIWSLCFERIQGRLLIGHGYDGFWTAERIEDISWELNWAVSSAHSEFIDIVLGVGIIGLSLHLLVWAIAVAWFWRRYFVLGLGADALILGMLWMGSVQGLMEAGSMHPSSLLPFVTLTGMVRLAFFSNQHTLRNAAI